MNHNSGEQSQLKMACCKEQHAAGTFTDLPLESGRLTITGPLLSSSSSVQVSLPLMLQQISSAIFATIHTHITQLNYTVSRPPFINSQYVTVWHLLRASRINH